MSWQTAAVIGATGGLGSALCDLLEERGCTVHRLSRASRAPEHRIDVEDEASIERTAAWCAAQGSVDLVLTATGALQGDNFSPEKDWRQLNSLSLARYFAINATGPALVAKHFLPLLPRQGISGFAALSARVGSISDNRLGGWYGYRASKAALNMIVKTASIELARKRPEAFCVALHPGTVATTLSAPHRGNVQDSKLFSPRQSAAYLLAVLARLGPADSGNCLDWNGELIAP